MIFVKFLKRLSKPNYVSTFFFNVKLFSKNDSDKLNQDLTVPNTKYILSFHLFYGSNSCFKT